MRLNKNQIHCESKTADYWLYRLRTFVWSMSLKKNNVDCFLIIALTVSLYDKSISKHLDRVDRRRNSRFIINQEGRNKVIGGSTQLQMWVQRLICENTII